MTQELTADLRAKFGFPAFRPGQEQAIRVLLNGGHALVVMPTGAGKSLVYQYIGVHDSRPVLVISPLISLMQDQVDALTRRGIPATFINSTLSTGEQFTRLRAMSGGDYRLIYVAPERLDSLPFRRALAGLQIGLLAVDEAHCVSEWGHDFRPDYLRIAQFRAEMGNPVTAALTATATPSVQDEIIRLLGLQSAERIVTGFNRPNLTFDVCYATDASAKLRALKSLFEDAADGGAIVYVGTRRDSEEVSAFVSEVVGIPASHYHGGLDAETRTRVQDSFLSGEASAVVATNAFGMGIDRQDVRLVAHFSIPGSLEAYYQEAGRAGRDGNPARAALIYSPQDRALQEWFIENDAPSADEAQGLYKALKARDGRECRVTSEDLSLDTGLHDVKVKVGLAQLEKAGVIHRLGDEGAAMLIGIERWDESAVRSVAADALKHRRWKSAQLERMVAYAEADSCRRLILLRHFGDRSEPESPACCDNCLAKQSSPAEPSPGGISEHSESELAALFILDALRRVKWDIGKGKLAQLLKGSKRKDMVQFGYDKNKHYGRLASYSAEEIKRMVDQLAARGYLKAVGGDLPVLRLTPRGADAIRARARIPLDLPRPMRPEVVRRKKAERQAGGTVELTEQMFATGLTPAQIASSRGLTDQTIYTHLAKLIGLGRLSLDAVVPEDIAKQIRAVIERTGDAGALSPIKERLPESISYGHIACVAEAWKREHKADIQDTQPQADETSDADDVDAFLARPHPRPLAGPWDTGWALGFHSSFAGGNWSRSGVGDLTYRLKYQADQSTLKPLVEQAMALIAEHPEIVDVDAIVPVPPSTVRVLDPVSEFAEALAQRVNLPVVHIVARIKKTSPQKEMRTLAQKRANVAGAFDITGNLRVRRLLVLDDLCDSGATLEEVTRVLQRSGAQRVNVLTLTRTIHTDG